MFPVASIPPAGPRHSAGIGSARVRTRRRSAVTGGAAVLLATITGCASLSSGVGSEMSNDINVNSTMMQEGRPLPDTFTCEEGVSPPLEWSGLPDEDEVSSLAVIMDDPSKARVYWVIYGMDPQIPQIRQDSVPQPGRQGRNTAGEAAYDPPCPEEGEEREYRFTVYALGSELNLPEGASLEDSLEGIAARAVARGSLTTTG
ncbi:YbhB/YbcL family Raf kinase inhibitor-like protein [Halostreptopolyspora alba]|uniref:YbhB/YbcL family Raf kinase inhibitor-like protein n=1 Tax=Halostreptopolyspora alba TaxID=2487137 RepID=A0A3N0EAV3_9ACTN|nr:YbhB/YbcL family Raf kinase inhibitor-like protein [Nocardiopsaceae bacterium YIM 96095]